VRFRILGTLSSEFFTGPAAARGNREARILGALLLNAGRRVSVNALVEMLWGVTPPATARQQVQNCTSAVDRRLRAAGQQPIQRVADGYCIDVPSDELDALTFEQSTVAGRRALEAGDFTRASRTLLGALDLWRGPVLDGLHLGPFEAAAIRLGEQRLAAAEDLVDCHLAIGRAKDILSDLLAAVNRHPLRERMVGQLMRALAAAGRPAEAIDLFYRTKSRLRDEYGLDPSQELIAAHLHVVRQDSVSLRTLACGA
jgi:DNA-binding SARP family transcriptional activator